MNSTHRLAGTLAGLAILVLAASGARAQKLYWTAVDEQAEYAIRRADPDGSNVEEILQGVDVDLGEIAVDALAGRIYWIQKGATTRVFRAEPDGTGIEVVHQTAAWYQTIAVDGVHGKLYLSGFGVVRMDLDGGAVEPLLHGEIGDVALDVVHGKMYWAQSGAPGVWGTDIMRADLDGSGVERVRHEPFDDYTYGLAVDPFLGKLYWATVDYLTDHAQVVSRANLDGTEVEELLRVNPGLDDWPVFLDVDVESQQLYWVNGEDGVLYSAATDGSDVEEIHEDSGPYGPFGLALFPSIDRTWVDLGGGTAGIAGLPLLDMSGPLTPSSVLALDLVDGAPSALAVLFLSFSSTPSPFLGGTLHAFPIDSLVVTGTDPAGEIHGAVVFPAVASGTELWFQVGIVDASVPIDGASLSQGVKGTVP